MRYITIIIILSSSILTFGQDQSRNEEINIKSSLLNTKIYNSEKLPPTSSLYVQGKKDADKHYDDFGPYAGTFFPSLIFPPAGLISTIVISSIPPKEFNLNIPKANIETITDPDYFNGYYMMAKRKKKLRAWTGFGTGTAFFAAGLLMFGYLSW